MNWQFANLSFHKIRTPRLKKFKSLKAACKQIQACNPGLCAQSTPFSITGLPQICQQYKDYEKGGKYHRWLRSFPFSHIHQPNCNYTIEEKTLGLLSMHVLCCDT